MTKSDFLTHDVYNQPEELFGYNLFDTESTLASFFSYFGVEQRDLSEFGELLGSPEVIEMARQANENPPKLRSYDKGGNRIDQVEFHPSWHRLMEMTISRGIASFPELDHPDKHAHLRRAVGLYLASQIEAGHGCPVSMTHASVPSLRHEPDLAKIWEPLLRSRIYDYSTQDPMKKAGLTMGMAMTEKQGGSDVRSNSTQARPLGDGTYELIGHKWFCSAPMSDGFMTLAYGPEGQGCFLVPRVLEDGRKNGVRIERLKDKLGNRSNASAEIEFLGAVGFPVGDQNRGVKTIMDMVGFCRLDSLVGSAAHMRHSLVQALWFASKRSAFSKKLLEHELMRNVLVDLALESKASTLMALRMSQAADLSASDGLEAQLKRVGVAISKFLVCKRAPGFVAEAMECLGGSGYVEDSVSARLFRESPLNGIWEGAGNVNALDVRRALAKEESAADAVEIELKKGSGLYSTYDEAARSITEQLKSRTFDEWSTRSFVASLGLLLQASLMIQFASRVESEAFVKSRLEQHEQIEQGGGHLIYGAIGPMKGSEVDEILDSVFPL